VTFGEGILSVGADAAEGGSLGQIIQKARASEDDDTDGAGQGA